MDEYLKINKDSWNKRTEVHVQSEFYDNESFLKGRNSLNSIELDLLGDVKGKSILHLQCHFGQDSISLARMGAKVTGVDLSDAAIDFARDLSKQCKTEVEFINCDVYDLPNHLENQFDVVFTSYGTIGWLPDIHKWANVVSYFMKPGGEFVFVEFHPVLWMFDDDFNKVAYRYFNDVPIEELSSGTYTNPDAPIKQEYVSWNHGMAEVVSALLAKGLTLSTFQEFDYSPYDCFSGTVEFEPGKYRIEKLGNRIPMVYALHCKKNS